MRPVLLALADLAVVCGGAVIVLLVAQVFLSTACAVGGVLCR